MNAGRSPVAGQSRHGVRWVSAAGLVGGLGLGLRSPLFVVAVGAGIYAGPTYLGLLFLLCLVVVLLIGFIALVVRGARELGAPIVALSGCLALGMLGGNWLAASLHINFAAPPPPREILPTGAGWTPTGDMLVGRSHHTATLLTDGRVLVAGGMGSDERMLSSAELYDPRTGTWSVTGSMIAPRSDHTATLLSDGRVLVASSAGQAELFDPKTGAWNATGHMATPRVSYATTLLRDGRVLVSGGRDSAIGFEDQLAPAELYDPTTGTWEGAGTMDASRYSHTATLLADGRVLISGGQGNETTPSNLMGFLASAELYDPEDATWTATGAMQVPRSVHAAVLLGDGRVLVAGGSPVAAMAELFDPVAGAWQLGGKVEGWMRPSAILLGDGRVLVVDGLGSLDLYDPRTMTSRSVAYAAHGFDPSATLLQDGKVLVAGGMFINLGRADDALAAAHLYEPP